MLRVIVVDSPVPPIGERRIYCARDGMTGREIQALYAPASWGEDVAVATLGRHLFGGALDEPLRDTEVVVMPDPGFEAVGAFLLFKVLIPAAIGLAMSYLWSLLAPPPRLPQERGDETSSTYSWQGIGTNYGAGFRIPVAYGLHDVGGQVVETSVEQLSQVTNTEVLASKLVLCEGPVHSVGGIERDADYLGTIRNPVEFGGSSPFPANLRVNGNTLDNTVAQAFVRLGSTYQPPIPSFTEARNSVAVNGELEDSFASIIEQVPTGDADRVAVRIEFPQGLYKAIVMRSGEAWYAPHVVEFEIRYRWEGGAWTAPQTFRVEPAVARRASFSTWLWFDLTRPSFEVNLYEVRVTRKTPAGGNAAPTSEQWVDYAIWRDLDYVIERSFAYPRSALLACRLRATEKVQGGQPQWQVRGKWRTVRVYDQAHGWSTDRFWELPPAGDTFAGIWSYPPGRNPAWIAADLLTSDFGLGHAFTTADLDAEAFRDWADFCDADDDGRAAFCFDGVFDRGENAWDALLRVFRAGRAIPVLTGNTIRPVYQFRDAHGRGTNVVPARSRVSIVATSNLEAFEVQYLPTRRRANMLEAQFLNEELDYEQDLLPQEDPDAEINDPTNAIPDQIRKQTRDFYGVTRARQVRRELLLEHALSRLVRKRIRCVAGPDQLPIEIGDIIGVQHDAYRPFGDRAVYFSCRAGRASSAVAEIVLDVDLTITDGARSVAVWAPRSAATGGLPGFWLIDEPNGTYPAGTVLATHSAVDIDVDAVVVVGEYDGDTVTPDEASGYGLEDYVVVGCTLDSDGKREIQGLLWTPDAYDIDPDLLAAGASPPSDDLGGSDVVPKATAISVVPAASGGQAEIRWQMPEGRQGKRARVYAARPGAALELLGQVVGDSLLADIDPDLPVQIAVAVEDDDGTFDSPGLAARVTAQPPEFRPVADGGLQGVEAIDTPDGVLLTWRTIQNPDVLYFEVRRGTVWTGAPVLARTEVPGLLLEGMPAGTHDLMVRVRFPGGLYSQRWSVASVTRAVWAHETRLATATADLTAGTYVRTAVVDGTLQLEDGAYNGTWTAAATLIDLGAPTTARWRVALTTHEVSGELCEVDDGSLCGDVENQWQEVWGREPSRRQPGCWSFDGDACSGDTGLVAHDRTLCTGPSGVLGQASRADLLASWDGGPWEVFLPGVRRAQTLAVRLLLDRIDPDRIRSVTELRAEAYA